MRFRQTGGQTNMQKEWPRNANKRRRPCTEGKRMRSSQKTLSNTEVFSIKPNGQIMQKVVLDFRAYFDRNIEQYFDRHAVPKDIIMKVAKGTTFRQVRFGCQSSVYLYIVWYVHLVSIVYRVRVHLSCPVSIRGPYRT